MRTDKIIETDRTIPRTAGATPWDGRVSTWERVADTPAFERLAQRVLALSSLKKTDVVVDLGAGTGLVTIPAARLAARVIAVDYSEMMLRRLRARTREVSLVNVECVQADLRRLPIRDESVDVVMSSYAFHHLSHEAKELALTEARRILIPGGRLVICDMMFALSLAPRDRRILAEKIAAVARKGPAGIIRLARNAFRIATRRWEEPATPERWGEMLAVRGFIDIEVEIRESEAGIATARRPERVGA